jgi:hypothetical protein
MTPRITEQPRAVLVDDDIHSARLLVRTLARVGGPDLKWVGGAERGLRLLANDYGGSGALWPLAVVVDLKGGSRATENFVRRLVEMLPGPSIPVIAFAPADKQEVRDRITAAGAVAVFARGADAPSYRREVAELAVFLNRRTFGGTRRAVAVEPAEPTIVGIDAPRQPDSADDPAPPPARKLQTRGADPIELADARRKSNASTLTAPGHDLPGHRGHPGGESEPIAV